MKSLFSILGDRYGNSSISKGILASQVVEEANKIIIEMFGPKATNHVSAVSFKNGVLLFSAKSPAASQNIRLEERAITRKINNTFGKEIVKRLTYS